MNKFSIIGTSKLNCSTLQLICKIFYNLLLQILDHVTNSNRIHPAPSEYHLVPSTQTRFKNLVIIFIKTQNKVECQSNSVEAALCDQLGPDHK